MMMPMPSGALIIAAAALLVVGVPPAASAGSSNDERVWREKYDAVFKRVPLKGATRADLSFEQVKRQFEELAALLAGNDALERKSVPRGEVKRVEFWTDAMRFKPDQCDPYQETRINSWFEDSAAGKSSEPMWQPNLSAFKERLLVALRDYCVGQRDEIVVKPLNKIPAKGLKVLAWIGEGDNVDFKKAAQHLAPYVSKPTKTKSKYDDKFPYIHMQTKHAFERTLKGPCERVDEFPNVSKRAINYLNQKQLLGEADLKAKQFVVAEQVCRMLNKFMDSLVYEMPKAILAHYNLSTDDLYIKENKLTRKLKGILSRNE